MAISQSNAKRLIAGAMSGTSADGVDIAITEITGTGLGMQCRLVHHHHHPYPAALRDEIFTFRGGAASANLARLAQLGRDISLAYAVATNEALLAAKLKASDLSAIAAHGQTLFHDPPNTIQWFDPSLVAAEVGCPVISDFRRADLAAGGQGAPLVPFADYILFRNPTKNRVLLNLGGIANITYLPAGGDLASIFAFDTGPANCISDGLCRNHDPSGSGFDAGGAIALSGNAHFATAFAFARSSYVFRKPPKSTDGPEMIDAFNRAKSESRWSGSFEDELATACLAVAYALGMTLDLFVKDWRSSLHELLASGGGTENACLMNAIREILKDTSVRLVQQDEWTISPHAKEAVAFALLGAATLDGFPSNVPSVTGANRAVILGSITPKP